MGMSAARRPAFARVRVVWAAWPARSLRRGRLGRRTRPVSPTAGSRWPASRSERRRDAPNAASSATLPRLALGHERLPLAEAPRNLHLGQPRLTARLAPAGEKAAVGRRVRRHGGRRRTLHAARRVSQNRILSARRRHGRVVILDRFKHFAV